MKRYLRWLMRRLTGSHRAAVREIPAAVRPRVRQPPMPDCGLDIEDLRRWLEALAIDDAPPGEMKEYARHDTERFVRTVDLVPKRAGSLLEIGANPYFTTMLLRWLRPEMTLQLTNFFGSTSENASQRVTVESPSGWETNTFAFFDVNVETSRLPFDDRQFDVALYCEVLEHMTNDPVAGLMEIHRTLKPGGQLVLTTPNAARLESVARLIAGLNLYDQYSGFGAYGRHNREYTVNELRALLTHCGFDEEVAYTADVHANHAALHVRDPGRLAELFADRADLLGQYIFSRWRRSSREPAAGKPAWLYRSLPPEALSTEVPLTEPPGARY